MLRTIDLRGRTLTPVELREALPRAEVNIDVATERVRPILHRVRHEGARALADLAENFDGVRPPSLRVPVEALTQALQALDPTVRSALEEAIRRARLGHEAQVPKEATTSLGPGAQVRQRWVPVQRVGLYVPGGLAALVSSVVMNVVPAQVAGVGSLAVASPPQKDNDGLPDATILAACALLGVDEVYAAGGAQAIGMFAYGVTTEMNGSNGSNGSNGTAGAAGTPRAVDPANSCPPVDVVTGPGNIYVAAAKRAVLGVVGIDSEAGTTEIAVLADESADPAYVAADLISQAEHDPAAGSVLVTDSPALAEAVAAQIGAQADGAKHAQRIRTALTGAQSGIVLADDLDHAIEVVDAYAAEHLEIHTADAAAVAERIHNAGAIFVGPHSPVPLGDYIAGSNHVLPTGGTARYASGLGVQAYLKSVQVICYDAQGLDDVTDHLVTLAESEDLPAHGRAATLRRER
ncbi:histidinol dehydrogenase [Ruania alkalisoli]|uniref:Histidinol dehydrogenase n=1 Tax=Ruania alkalisoli TaxID=2779775 RepID=A0A7M1SX98_9MICO|nr:histidinol dehydrogenase [Ruania alkalisoli]QOR72165.1 histidinol dehydrogenase [Ruania alkalisoli]